MIKTEKEAMRQWCPFARTPIWITEDTAVAGNRMTDATFGVNMNCVGSECQAWRWHYHKDERGNERVTTRQTDETWACEECNGTGRVGKLGCAECEGKGKGRKWVPVGYCGLAGRPGGFD